MAILIPGISTVHDPAQVTLLWHINHASFLTESPKTLFASPAFATPTGDTWRMTLKPKGVRHGADPCRIVYQSGREPVHIVTKGQVSVMTPKLVWTCFFKGPLPVVRGGEVPRYKRFECRPREDGEGDRVTVQVRLWLTEGVPVDLRAMSTLRLTPLLFTATYDGKAVERRLVLDVPVRNLLKKDIKLDMWSPDGDRWGLIVHLSGHLFDGVQSLKGTFILAHRSPVDPAKVIVTSIKRTVMFHRWNKGSSFRVPPFFPRGPACVVCEFLSFSGDVEECHDVEASIRPPAASVRGDEAAATEHQEVKLVVDVEQEEELRPKTRRMDLGSLAYMLYMDKFATTLMIVLVLVVVIVLIVSAVSGFQFGSTSIHSIMD